MAARGEQATMAIVRATTNALIRDQKRRMGTLLWQRTDDAHRRGSRAKFSIGKPILKVCARLDRQNDYCWAVHSGAETSWNSSSPTEHVHRLGYCTATAGPAGAKRS